MSVQVLSTKEAQLAAEAAAALDPLELAREASMLASEHAELSRKLAEVEQRQQYVARQLDTVAEAAAEAAANAPAQVQLGYIILHR